jgi:hypothetical protein
LVCLLELAVAADLKAQLELMQLFPASAEFQSRPTISTLTTWLIHSAAVGTSVFVSRGTVSLGINRTIVE